jgi:glycosyltransferase involved in cell wall biosynthesis
MAGPGIRCWEMGRLLARAGHQVRVSAPRSDGPDGDGFEVVDGGGATLERCERWADVMVVQGFVLTKHPVLADTRKHLVVDLYDPYPLEALEAHAGSAMPLQVAEHWPALGSLLLQLRTGDLFLCASDRQRDFWMGCLLASDRLNPRTFAQDRLFHQLIAVAPFGLSPLPPRHSGRPAARGVLPGIGPDARLAIWAGGIWNWFDPLSLVQAWPAVMREEPAARLLFLGTRHPNPSNPEMAMGASALRAATELGLRDRGITFNEGWVPYERRADFLLEADLGVSMHFHTLEARLSFRTRFLDYIWAGLPSVATEGDVFAEWIAREGTGRVVPYEDSPAIARAVVELLGNDALRGACADAVRSRRERFTWERALEPLLRYCEAPWFAADLEGRRTAQRGLAATGDLQPRPGLVGRARWYMRREGPSAFLQRAARKLGREARARLRR